MVNLITPTHRTFQLHTVGEPVAGLYQYDDLVEPGKDEGEGGLNPHLNR